MILVLTAGFGDGHNTAARSVAQALASHAGASGSDVHVVDLFENSLPRLTRFLQSAYQTVIVHFPAVWRWAYQKLSSSRIGHHPNPVNERLQQALAALIRQHHPRALVSTYPFYSTLLAHLRALGPVPPLFTVVTDSISVHPSWTSDHSDVFCVADQDTAKILEERQIPPSTIFVTGFPVSPAFSQPDPAPPPEHSPPRLLYLPSTPVRHVRATLGALRPLLLSGTTLTLAAGKHQRRLQLTLNRFADSLPPGCFSVLGWTDQMPHLLRSCDAVICKAGGAILHEVLAARIPVIIDYVVPGQEEGNAELLLKNRCALRSRSPAETAAAASSLLADNKRVAREIRSRMIPPLSLPDAARCAARVIHRFLESPAPPSSHAQASHSM